MWSNAEGQLKTPTSGPASPPGPASSGPLSARWCPTGSSPGAECGPKEPWRREAAPLEAFLRLGVCTGWLLDKFSPAESESRWRYPPRGAAASRMKRDSTSILLSRRLALCVLADDFVIGGHALPPSLTFPVELLGLP